MSGILYLFFTLLIENSIEIEEEADPSTSHDESEGSLTARARKTRSQSYFPRLKPAGPNSASSTSGEYPSLKTERTARRRPSEKQLTKGSLNPRMLAAGYSQNNSPVSRESSTMREKDTRYVKRYLCL
jgi:hypothetical protein